MNLVNALKNMGISVHQFQSPWKPEREFWWTSICSLLKFQQVCSPSWVSLSRPPVHCNPVCTARPLVTAEESVKPQHRCFYYYSILWSLLGKQYAIQSKWAELFLLSWIRIVAFQIGCCPFTLELLLTSQAALYQSAEASSWGSSSHHPRANEAPCLYCLLVCPENGVNHFSFYYGTLLGTVTPLRCFNSLVQNPRNHHWAVLRGFCYQP